MGNWIYLHLVLLAAVLVVPGGPRAWAQQDGEARLGGASDVAHDTVVRIPQGGEIGPLHYIFVDNPTDQPIEVELVADTPAGIAVEAEWEETVVPAQGRAQNVFGISVGSQVAAGDYEVVVQLVRSDIEVQPGRITNIPAVQTSFTVEVTGEAGILRVGSVSAVSGEPVSGTLTVAAQTADGADFEVARGEGSSLEVEVAPGEYRVSFLLGDRTLDTADVMVEADDTIEAILEVETVSFVVAVARPTLQEGRPVVVELTAAVNNEAEPITTGADLRVIVLHNGTEADTVTLDKADGLPIGLNEASTTYRPSDGWKPGTYQFRFELVTPRFTLVAPQIPSLDVPPPPPGWDLRLLIFIVAVALLLLLFIDRIRRDVAARIRRRRRLYRGLAGLAKLPTVKGEPVAAPTPATPADDQGNRTYRESHTDTDTDRQPTERPSLIPSPTRSTVRDHDRPAPRTSTDGAARMAQSVHIAQRLADRGDLAADWSIADAAMMCWIITSEEVHEALTSLGMDHQEYTTAISKLLRRGLLGAPQAESGN